MAKPRPKQNYGVPKGRNNTPVIIGAAALVLVLGLVAVLAASLGGGGGSTVPDNAAPYRSATISGAPIAPAGEGGADTAVGTVAPTVVGQTFTGEPATIQPGSPKVITFYAHWCPHCQAELPGISKWLRDNKSDFPNVDVVAVATGTQPSRANFPPAEWFADEKYPLPVIADDQNSTIANAFGVNSYPQFVVLDRENKVVARTSGEIGIDEYERLVRQAAAP